MQANIEGDISERARRRAVELARGTEIRTTVPKSMKQSANSAGNTVTGTVRSDGNDRLPPAESEIVRAYKGETILVRVLASGFEYDGEIYKSLSAVAKKITGQHCNGYHFFKLNKKGGSQ